MCTPGLEVSVAVLVGVQLGRIRRQEKHLGRRNPSPPRGPETPRAPRGPRRSWAFPMCVTLPFRGIAARQASPAAGSFLSPLISPGPYGPTVKAIPSLHGPYPAGLQTWIHQVAGPGARAVLGV